MINVCIHLVYKLFQTYPSHSKGASKGRVVSLHLHDIYVYNNENTKYFFSTSIFGLLQLLLFLCIQTRKSTSCSSILFVWIGHMPSTTLKDMGYNFYRKFLSELKIEVILSFIVSKLIWKSY